MLFIRCLYTCLLGITLQTGLLAQPFLIPQPFSVDLQTGHFSITPDCYILANDFDAFMDAAAFKDMLYTYLNIPLKTSIKTIPEKTAIVVQYDSTLALPDAGYILEISPQKIIL
ncbi:MAG: hypothetical protein ACK4IY_05610, partial [Chitinophagales bacterium]